jgi:hypothetical protein
LGDLRVFHSLFGQQVEERNVRLTEDDDHGGGPLFDTNLLYQCSTVPIPR